MKPRKVAILVLLILLVVSFLFYVGKKLITAFGKQLDQTRITYEMPSRDSSLISRYYLDRTKVFQIVNIEGRPPFSIYTVDDNYELTISKIPLSGHFFLKDGLLLSTENVEQTSGIGYYNYNFTWDGHVKIQTAPLHAVSGIWLTISGDSLRTFSTDSSRNFSLLCNSFSIRYSEQGPIDIFVSGVEQAVNEVVKPVSMDLMLLQRDDAVYFFTLVSKNPDEVVRENLLHDVIYGK